MKRKFDAKPVRFEVYQWFPQVWERGDKETRLLALSEKYSTAFGKDKLLKPTPSTAGNFRSRRRFSNVDRKRRTSSAQHYFGLNFDGRRASDIARGNGLKFLWKSCAVHRKGTKAIRSAADLTRRITEYFILVFKRKAGEYKNGFAR